MVFWNVSEVSKIKIFKPSVYEILRMMQRERMLFTDAYDTVNLTSSRMDNSYVNVLEYISYLLSFSVVYSIKYILGPNIFLFGGNE